MIMWALRKRGGTVARRRVGLALALAGLVVLVLPGISAPSLGGSILMLSAGVAWSIYSLRGKAPAIQLLPRRGVSCAPSNGGGFERRAVVVGPRQLQESVWVILRCAVLAALEGSLLG
jgi:threonine/homoserine efflux transporter RhtA